MPGSKVGRFTSVGWQVTLCDHIMASDLSSVLEVCFKRDALNKLMFTLLYFTLKVM